MGASQTRTESPAARLQLGGQQMQRATSPQAIADTQDRLRHAALELFTSQGYQSTSLRDLAAHLGMQAGSLYNHIESKQALLFDLIEEALDALLAETRSSIRRGKNREERLRLFVQVSLCFQKREHKRMALIHRETINLTQEQQQQVQHLVDEYAGCLEWVIADRRSATVTPDSRLKLLIGAIIGMIHGLQSWGCNDPSPPLREEVEQLTRMINGAIGAASA